MLYVCVCMCMRVCVRCVRVCLYIVWACVCFYIERIHLQCIINYIFIVCYNDRELVMNYHGDYLMFVVGPRMGDWVSAGRVSEDMLRTSLAFCIR